ncbi:baseplate J/gp47 family protein [Fusobacterium sp. IOR10]|uniref:baseplate J/gp47 family protein n=1 Tax=Fusobacterium sp. IOR10 TaxID=2665157 RepID=UPI001EF039C9|nr:baseplate J/gp47 family protein [Fusobacterium sp. IOR10]
MEYKAQTTEEVHEEMLSTISGDYLKIPGTFTYDLTKSQAIEDAKLQEKIKEVYNKLDIYNLDGSELSKYTFQRRGVKRKKAVNALGTLTITGTAAIKIGDIFETENGARFESIENKEIINAGEINIKSVTPGTIENVGANSITLIPISIPGITSITNTKQTHDGYDEETDDSLRERYLIEVQKPATSGNIYHYLQWAREVEGVGDARVFPLWNGNNTVKVLIIDDNKVPGTEELKSKVQNYIDPNIEGAGAGQAPIGAYCTVENAIAKEVNITLSLILENTDISQIKPQIEKTIKNYLKSIAFQKDYVSYALLSSFILSVPGVSDWEVFKINGEMGNISILENEVAVLGSVVINE